MTIYVAWTDEAVEATTPGPWRELHVAAPGLVFIDSADTLSRVYHELKWSLPDGAALLVVPAAAAPKFKRLAPGSLTWLRRH
jgi:hypothetical protein